MSTIILADDHQILRESLCLLLNSQPDFQVIAEAGDGREALQLTEQLKPDVLIVDMMMPGLSGLDVARQVRRAVPATKVIVLSMHDTESYVVESLEAGAVGYVLKQSSSQELTHAIREALIRNEPRLRAETLEVRMDDAAPSVEQRLTFEIVAEMIADPTDIPLQFYAEVDPAAGKIAMKRMQGEA